MNNEYEQEESKLWKKKGSKLNTNTTDQMEFPRFPIPSLYHSTAVFQRTVLKRVFIQKHQFIHSLQFINMETITCQASNGPSDAQAPNGVQAPQRKTCHARTPLGEPMDPRSASSLAEDPLRWHLRYWLDLSVVAQLRGEDSMLIGFSIELEQYKTRDQALRTRLVNAWKMHQLVNHASCSRHWNRLTLDSPRAKPYLRDLDRMLVDKETKTRRYLCQQVLRTQALYDIAD